MTLDEGHGDIPKVESLAAAFLEVLREAQVYSVLAHQQGPGSLPAKFAEGFDRRGATRMNRLKA